MLTRLQMLPCLRGVNRIEYRSSSIRRRMPSIQPKHRATSTDSAQVRLGCPVARFLKPTRASGACSWLASSQFSNSDADEKNMARMPGSEPVESPPKSPPDRACDVVDI